MKRLRLFLFIAGLILTHNLWFAFDSSSSWAMDCSLYELTEVSHYTEGCFDPCMCPIFANFTLQGRFQLASLFQGEDGAFFEVQEVDWQFIQGDETILVTGSGYYQIDSGQHRLMLDLLVGAGPVQQFDSGMVPMQVDFPGIHIAVAVNGFYCYDHVFDITALPAPVNVTSSTWGSLKSTFR